MVDNFYEETSINNHYDRDKKFYNAFKISAIVAFVLAFFLVILLWANLDGSYKSNNIMLDIITSLIPLIILFVTGFVLWQVKNRYCNDFDYTVVGNNIRISKVSNNVKRRHIINFDCNQIEKIGLFQSESYNELLKREHKLIFLTSNGVNVEEGKRLFYLCIFHEGLMKILIIECSDTLISNILKSSKKFVLAEELK